MKNLIRFAAAALLCAAAAGCGERTVAPVFERFTADTLVRCGAVPCRIACDLQLIANADRSEALGAVQNALLNYGFGFTDFYGTPGEALDAFIGAFTDEYAVDTLYNEGMEYYVTVRSDIRPVDSLLVCSVGSASFTGGAHGMRSVSYHNMVAASGYELSLGDLFTEEQYLAFAEAIRAKLCEATGAADDGGLSAAGYFPDQIVPTENFEVLPDGGIVFHYNPYDIACYACGPVDVTFTADEIAALGR